MSLSSKSRLLAALAALAIAAPLSAFSSDLGTLTGVVKDSTGSPLAGAVVLVSSAISKEAHRMVFSDRFGRFSVPNLFVGDYSVRVSMARFLSANKSGIRVRAGVGAVVTVNLQNALDVVRGVSGRRVSDDTIWAMRASTVSQPILRLADSGVREPETESKVRFGDYTGYVELYSRSATSGVDDTVGSQFAVTMPLPTGSRVTVAGQYTEAPDQPRGFGAVYEFSPSERHHSTVGVDFRRGATFGGARYPGVSGEIQLRYSEELQVSKHFALKYGAQLGRNDGARSKNYLRPRVGLFWIPSSRTVVGFESNAQEPASADLSHDRDYFERAAYGPTASKRSHLEIEVTRTLAEGLNLTLGAFEDRAQSQALFVSYSDDKPAVVLLDTSRLPFRGVRVSVNRVAGKTEFGVGYTQAAGIPLDSINLTRPEEAARVSDTRTLHSMSARFKADLDLTQTQVTAVYRWISAPAASQIDPHQKFSESNDPYLNILVAQDLPTLKIVPGRIQAILDARSLLDPGTRHPNATLYPRLLKGGISIRF